MPASETAALREAQALQGYLILVTQKATDTTCPGGQEGGTQCKSPPGGMLPEFEAVELEGASGIM